MQHLVLNLLAQGAACCRIDVVGILDAGENAIGGCFQRLAGRRGGRGRGLDRDGERGQAQSQAAEQNKNA